VATNKGWKRMGRGTRWEKGICYFILPPLHRKKTKKNAIKKRKHGRETKGESLGGKSDTSCYKLICGPALIALCVEPMCCHLIPPQILIFLLYYLHIKEQNISKSYSYYILNYKFKIILNFFLHHKIVNYGLMINS
jgi:hypothetical protein